DEKTIVFFSSDNGPHREGGNTIEFYDANSPLTGTNRSLTDCGFPEPFIDWWPGKIRAGVVSSHVGYFGDIMATFAQLAGAPAPEGLDSISLVPVLTGSGEQSRHEHLYWEFYEGGVSQAVLLAGRWKGIRLRKPAAPIALFDLSADIA